MKFKVFNNKKFNLHVLNVNNFRSSHLELIFRCKFDSKKAAAFALLSDILTDASKDYPSSKYVVRHMEESYILDFYGSFTRNGKVMQTYIICDYVDPRYIDEKNYLNNVYDFIFNMLKNPLIKDGKFDSKLFDLAKRRMLTDLKSYADDNNFLSMNKALKIFAEDTPTSFHMYDMIDFVSNLTNEELYEYYLDLINNSSVDIFVTTSTDSKVINELVKSNYPFKKTSYESYNELIYHNNRLLPKKVVDKSKFKQSTIVMVFNVNNINMFEREFVMPYFLNVLNTSDLNSKLYDALRNKNGLCYSVQSSCFDRSNIILVRSTIKVGYEKKAIRLIKKCFNDMKNNVTDEEFVRAYYAFTSSLKGMVDSIGAINRLYMNMYYANFSSYEEKLEKYKTVKVSDINNLANKIRLNTIYVLKGDINERNQD